MIAESIRELAEITRASRVEVWIEDHGDFAGAGETAAILQQSASPNAGVIWDPVNSFAANQERPAECAARLGAAIRHIHIEDLRRDGDGWKYVLTSAGTFPLVELRARLRDIQYDRFLSFEWEKKWHPQLADADIALPHFARWFRRNFA